MHRLLAAFFAVFVVFAGPVLAQPSRYLISAQPMTDTPPGVQAWRIQYWTTNGNGQRFAVTGIVAAPMEATPPRPAALSPGPTAHGASPRNARPSPRSEEHTSELQSIKPNSYAVLWLKKKKQRTKREQHKIRT